MRKRLLLMELLTALLHFFDEKVTKIVNNAHIDPNVYSGKAKMGAGESNFITVVRNGSPIKWSTPLPLMQR